VRPPHQSAAGRGRHPRRCSRSCWRLQSRCGWRAPASCVRASEQGTLVGALAKEAVPSHHSCPQTGETAAVSRRGFSTCMGYVGSAHMTRRVGACRDSLLREERRERHRDVLALEPRGTTKPRKLLPGPEDARPIVSGFCVRARNEGGDDACNGGHRLGTAGQARQVRAEVAKCRAQLPAPACRSRQTKAVSRERQRNMGRTGFLLRHRPLTPPPPCFHSLLPQRIVTLPLRDPPSHLDKELVGALCG